MFETRTSKIIFLVAGAVGVAYLMLWFEADSRYMRRQEELRRKYQNQ